MILTYLFKLTFKKIESKTQLISTSLDHILQNNLFSSYLINTSRLSNTPICCTVSMYYSITIVYYSCISWEIKGTQHLQRWLRHKTFQNLWKFLKSVRRMTAAADIHHECDACSNRSEITDTCNTSSIPHHSSTRTHEVNFQTRSLMNLMMRCHSTEKMFINRLMLNSRKWYRHSWTENDRNERMCDI